MSDPAVDRSAMLLESILQTLNQINGKMSVQERRWDRLDERLGSSTTIPPKSGEITTACPPLSSPNPTNLENEVDRCKLTATQRLQWMPSNEAPNHNLGALCLAPLETREEDNSIADYRSWRSPLENSPLHQYSPLTEGLGDAWTMPDDDRLPLSFSREVLEGLKPDQLRATVSYISRFRDRMARSNDLRFHVIDYDSLGRNIVYRLGLPAVNGFQEWKPKPKVNATGGAPWRRFVLCQGLNTAQDTGHDSTERVGCSDQAPFLLDHDRCNTRQYLMTAMDNHITCWKRDQSLRNRYENYWTAFHITFYEAPSVFTPQVTKNLPRGHWRHGSLYGSKERDFCESALTLIAIPSASHRPDQPPTYALGQQHEQVITRDHHEWSILLLAPLGFFDSGCHQFPLSKDSFQARIGERSMEGATVYLLEDTYRQLYYNWRIFKLHFQGLLDEGDEENALFRPALHDELLQDDEMFSRSRKYAWVIKCLTNFESSISDNIFQWKSFKSARLDHIIKAGRLSMASRTSIDNIDLLCTQLEALHQYFSMKLVSTRELRDGLFSASAVIESRASTRLATNIKLLTFVSIFFQPLAFCTSLWSVNNIFSSTALIYTSIAVGLSTYIIVFHLNNLVSQTSSVYTPMRDRIISRMKHDSHQHWASKGKQFATFQPKHERLRPSEWWILLFWAQTLLKSLQRFLSRRPEPASTDTGPSPETIVIGDEDGASPKEAETGTQSRVETLPTAMALGLSDESTQPPATEARSQTASQGGIFPFPLGFMKKHKPTTPQSSPNPPTHEDV